MPADTPSGGHFKITFPPNRVNQYTSSTLACTDGALIIYTCTAVWTTGPTLTPGPILTVTITNPCTSGCSSGLFTISLSGGMKNPDAVPYLKTSFVIDTTDSSGFIVAEGQVIDTAVSKILPEPITIATVKRGSTTLSA